MARFTPSDAQDRCEIGDGSPPLATCGGSGRTFSVPELSVLITSLKAPAKLDWFGMHPDLLSSGSSAKASFVPSGLIAGRMPGAIATGLPPSLLTDSTCGWQPVPAAK